MKTTDLTTDLLSRYEQRRLRGFHRRQQQLAGTLTSMRNQRARRRLVAGYGLTLVAMLVCIPLSFLNDLVLLVWVPIAMAMAIIWTMLNITVDSIDSAPLTALDEYEAERVTSLRSLSYLAFGWFGLSASITLVLLGTVSWQLDATPDWLPRTIYTLGQVYTVLLLVIVALPTVVIAWTTPDEPNPTHHPR